MKTFKNFSNPIAVIAFWLLLAVACLLLISSYSCASQRDLMNERAIKNTSYNKVIFSNLDSIICINYNFDTVVIENTFDKMFLADDFIIEETQIFFTPRRP